MHTVTTQCRFQCVVAEMLYRVLLLLAYELAVDGVLVLSGRCHLEWGLASAINSCRLSNSADSFGATKKSLKRWSRDFILILRGHGNVLSENDVEGHSMSSTTALFSKPYIASYKRRLSLTCLCLLYFWDTDHEEASSNLQRSLKSLAMLKLDRSYTTYRMGQT